MTMATMAMKNTFLAIVITALAYGCAAAPQAKKRLFFPFPPEQPRIELIGVYQNEHSFPKSGAALFKEKLFGRSPGTDFGRPMDVASDGKGTVYIADMDMHNISIYDLNNYTIGKLDGEGEVFSSPVGVTLDKDGNIYVADSKKQKVFVFSKDKRPLFAFGQKGETVDWPVRVAVDDERDRIYVANSHMHKITVFDKKGKYLHAIGKRGSGDGEFNYPLDVDVASDGRIVVADAMNARIQVFDREGSFIRAFGKRGDAPDAFDMIKGVAISKDDYMFIVDGGANMIKVYDLDGKFLLPFGTAYSTKAGKVMPGGFSLPTGIDVDGRNGIFVADSMNKAFHVFQFLDEEYLAEHPLPQEGSEEVAETTAGNAERAGAE